MKNAVLAIFVAVSPVATLASTSDSIAPDTTGMASTTSAVTFSGKMGAGWNVGNAFESVSNSTGYYRFCGETCWGSARITQTLIDSVYAAGFRSIRLPVAWSDFSDSSSYTIDSSLLKRVDTVVKYATSLGMYVLLNEHWDGGWQIPTYSDSGYANKRLRAIWKQIAKYFRDYDNHLLFAGTNEVKYDYSDPSAEYLAVQNNFNKIFLNAVRSTGGRNYYRYLALQAYNTNITYGVAGMTLPTDRVSNRVFVEVHYYDPYTFTDQTGQATQWGKYATSTSLTAGWANEGWADSQFTKLDTHFVDKGYPIVMGEYGANYQSSYSYHETYRGYWLEYITSDAVKHGVVPFYWDNNSTSDGGFALFNRSTGAQLFPDDIDSIMLAFKSSTTSVSPILKAGSAAAASLRGESLEIVLASGEATARPARLMDVSGRIVASIPVASGSNVRSLEGMRPGIYFLDVPTASGEWSARLLKAR